MLSVLRKLTLIGACLMVGMPAQAEPVDQWRSFISELAGGLARAGESIGAPTVEAAAGVLSAQTLCVPASDATILSREARALYPGILQRLRKVQASHAAPRDASRNRTEGSWPVAECVLANADNGSWLEFRNELISLTAIADSLALLENYCQRPQVRAEGVESTGLKLSATCHAPQVPEYSHGDGHIKIDEQGLIRWPRAANCVETCSALETASLLSAQLLAELQENWLGCRRDGYVTASYQRLEYLRDELDGLREDLDFVIEYQTETALQVWGGTRTAVLYLPESLGGRLETIAAMAQSAVDDTAAAGYDVSPRIYRHLTQAAAKVAAGSYKDGFDLYREAYEEVTAGSQRRVR